MAPVVAFSSLCESTDALVRYRYTEIDDADA
jgi:hypothetical protein